MPERKKLGEILVELQVLTPAEVERILHALRKRCDRSKFGQTGREMGLLREEHILAALAVQMQLFPNIQQMSLNKLMGCLQDPVSTPTRLPPQKVRRLLEPMPKRRDNR